MSENVVLAPAGENWFSISRSFDAPRRLIYKCYTEPQHMAHFWGPRGSTLTECKVDLQVGGVWLMGWTFPDGRGWRYASVYLGIVPDSELHYRDAPDDWAFGLDGLPPVELDSSIALADQGRPASAYDIAEELGKRRGKRVAANSVYRILDLFVRSNLANRIESANAYLVNTHPGCRHHGIYLICDDCGQAIHLDDDKLTDALREAGRRHGFADVRPVVELRGLCNECAG